MIQKLDAWAEKFHAGTDWLLDRVLLTLYAWVRGDPKELKWEKTLELYFGDVLRNEAGTLIVRRSYNLERTLGAPDTAQPAEIQAELVIGAVGSEFTLNIPSAELLNVDMVFVAIDNAQRTGPTGPKQSSVVIPVSASEYNTSSDVGRIRLSTVSAVDEAVTALFDGGFGEA